MVRRRSVISALLRLCVVVSSCKHCLAILEWIIFTLLNTTLPSTKQLVIIVENFPNPSSTLTVPQYGFS